MLAKVRENGYEYLMLVEFQARPDRRMAGRLLEYTAMHHRRHEKPIYPVVINLTGKCLQAEKYIMDCLDLTVVDFSYRMINLEEVAGRDLLYRGPVALLPLAPLMRQEDPPEAVLEKCVKRIKSEVVSDDDRAVLYVALAALSSLKFSKDMVLKILGVIKLENIPLFDAIREEWEARGIIKGREEGREEGKVEVARNLLLLNMDTETVVKATGLDMAKVDEIKKQPPGIEEQLKIPEEVQLSRASQRL